jgi:histidinol-phosphate aminotransferase
MSKNAIDNLRDKINALDDKILNLLDERSEVVSEIGKFKDRSKGFVDTDREHSIIERLLKNLKGKYSKDSIVRIWRELFHASTQVQISKDLGISAKRGIENIQIYKGGQSTIKGFSNFIKLSSNENAIGPSTDVNSIVLKENNLNRYPEINGYSLRNQLSKLHSINVDQIVLGNGSDEILSISALAFCQPGDEIIHSTYGFEMYPIIAKIVGAVSVKAEEINYKVSVDSIIDNITASTKVIFIANPNNPTGTYLNKKDLNKLVSNVAKDIVIVVDGAYAEYVTDNDYEDSFNLIDRYENLILTRTFSKAYGLAGMRLGWCYTSNKLASILNKIKPPFNANTVALKMASVALQDIKHLSRVISENIKNKKWFEQELKKLNIKYLPTAANFTFVECDQNSEKAQKINNLLLENGVIVRQLHSYGLPHCLRITIGMKEDMEKTIAILQKGNLF